MMTDSEIIDYLGGNQAVADLCAPTGVAVVSGWRKRGIPRAWKAFLRARRPDAFDDSVAPNFVDRRKPIPRQRRKNERRQAVRRIADRGSI